jgi:hypothetical protein
VLLLVRLGQWRLSKLGQNAQRWQQFPQAVGVLGEECLHVDRLAGPDGS